jgi:hypothetical protein
VVEDHKNNLIDEIIETCRKIPAAENLIPNLEEARRETQFSKAIKRIGDAIPDALRIDRHNPLTLLHQAISRDLHSASDEECLQAASAIRIVLTELSERVSQITRENSELKTALGKLFGKPSNPWIQDRTSSFSCNKMTSHHSYEVRPRKDRRGFDPISDKLPFV